MADFRLKGILDFDTTKASASIQDFSKSSAKSFQAIRSFGTETLQNMSTVLTQVGATMTGSITAAVVVAKDELPEVNEILKDMKESFTDISLSVAQAVIPDLEDFKELLNGIAGVMQGISERTPELIRGFLKIGVMTTIAASITFALGQVFRMIGLIGIAISKLGRLLGIALLPFIKFLAILGLIAGAIYGLTLIFPQLGQAIQSFASKTGDAFLKVTGLDVQLRKFKAFMEQMMLDFEGGAKKATNILNDFSKGFRANLNELSKNIESFGSAISSSLETHLGDAIFNAITGKVVDLKNLLLEFANDITKAFSKIAADQILASLFGDAQGGLGIFGRLFGKKKEEKTGAGNTYQQQINNTTINNFDRFDRELRQSSRDFRDLGRNMDFFARMKDRAIDKLKEFSRKLEDFGISKNIQQGGFAGMGADIAKTIDGIDTSGVSNMMQPISDEVLESIETTNALLGVMSGFVTGISEGWKDSQKQVIKYGVIFAATTAAMLVISYAASKLAVMISGAAAEELAALWAPAAIAASIATLGVAAVEGAAAYVASVAVGTAFTTGLQKSGGDSGGGDTGSNASVSWGNYTDVEGYGAEGAIVRRPTFALIGEDGDEAVVPLHRTSGNGALPNNMFGGSRSVSIHADKILLNTPANMKQFIKRLKEEMVRD